MYLLFFCFKQKTAYEMRISDWSSDVCSSDLLAVPVAGDELSARLYVPAEKAGALLVYFHGGGWVVGGLAAFDPLCRELAAGAGVAIISEIGRASGRERVCQYV